MVTKTTCDVPDCGLHAWGEAFFRDPVTGHVHTWDLCNVHAYIAGRGFEELKLIEPEETRRANLKRVNYGR